MKLDVNALRYLSGEDWRVLTAVELGMRNHQARHFARSISCELHLIPERLKCNSFVDNLIMLRMVQQIVPAELIERIARLRGGGAFKRLSSLLRHKLVHHDSSRGYDGYRHVHHALISVASTCSRLTNLGYDFLALHAMTKAGTLTGIGRQLGVGKESDIFEAAGADGESLVMKFHRLGRTSFRAVRHKRDYLRHRTSTNWLYLSRLAAAREAAFMRALKQHGFPVPEAVDANRHCVLMTLVPGYPLVQASAHICTQICFALLCASLVVVKQVANPAEVYEQLMGWIVRLAQHGLIHCDFNEFNVMVDDEERLTLIDFPQMVSTSHRNARMYFDRDVACVAKFFRKRFGYPSPVDEEEEEDSDVELAGLPSFDDILAYRSSADFHEDDIATALDVELEASGFTKEQRQALESYSADAGEPSDGEEGGVGVGVEGESVVEDEGVVGGEHRLEGGTEQVGDDAQAASRSGDDTSTSERDDDGTDGEGDGGEEGQQDGTQQAQRQFNTQQRRKALGEAMKKASRNAYKNKSGSRRRGTASQGMAGLF
eukprot:jgi/Chlat1/2286/Chrsp17S02792